MFWENCQGLGDTEQNQHNGEAIRCSVVGQEQAMASCEVHIITLSNGYCLYGFRATVQHSSAQCSTLHISTVEYTTVMCSLGQNNEVK